MRCVIPGDALTAGAAYCTGVHERVLCQVSRCEHTNGPPRTSCRVIPRETPTCLIIWPLIVIFYYFEIRILASQKKKKKKKKKERKKERK